MDVEGGTLSLGEVLAGGGPARLVETLKSLPIALVGKTSCAYSLEAQATLASAAAHVGGTAAVSTFWLDKVQDGSAVWAALRSELKQATVPYCFVGGEFLGGCDAVTKLASRGELAPKVLAAAAAAGSSPAPVGASHVRSGSKASASAGGTSEEEGSPSAGKGGKAADKAAAELSATCHDGPLPYMPDCGFADPHCKPALGEETPRAYPCLFWFPEVVDGNVIRLTAAQVVVVCILAIIWRTHTWAHYLVLGLALDNLGRLLFGAGPSPLAQAARCGAALLKPSFRPGVPKQFASACATFMSVVATVFMFLSGFDHQEIIPSIFLGMYGFLAALEAGIDFCMGCVMFSWAVKFGLIPKEVYTVGIATKPEAEYTYEEAVKRLDLPEPQKVRIGYPGKPPSTIDVKYKTKLNDHDRQSWSVIKHTKITLFNAVLGVCGLAAVWRAASLPVVGGAAGLSIPSTTGDVLAIMAVVLLGLLSFMYAAKAFFQPNKVRKEWQCPLRSNAFVIPPASLVLVAFCTAGRFGGATTLAKVLFWIGAPLTLAVALYLAARWLTDPHSQEHLHAAWLLPPTACFVCAVVAPFLDTRYGEAAYLWFALAVALAVPLYVLTFNKAVLFKEADDRNRPLKWVWVAVPAVACVAQVALSAATTSGGTAGSFLGADAAPLPFDFLSRLLYLLSLSLAMVLGLLFMTGHASRLRFDVSSWSLAFPLEALALGTLLYAAAIPGVLTNGMAYAALATSSVAVLVLSLHTIQALLMGGIFVMDPKYGPLSQQILTHEAFRAAGQRLKAAAAALGTTGKAGAVNSAALADFALQFRRYRLAHAWHAHHEDSVIFKEFETYVPGLCTRQHDEHARDEEAMERWGGLLEGLEADPAGPGASQALATLQAEVPAFIDGFEAHLIGEEEHLQRAGRKQLCLDLQKGMLRRMWEATPPAVWAEFLPFVVANLPMHAQRVKFLRCWALWAVPERAQLIGRYVALGVDAPLWERLALAVPEIIPRGAHGWRKYY
ncbi:hypothetical protein ABPG77_007102 [Micractinium sp. CCAP 211/92]